MAERVKWTAIVLTCQNKDSALALQIELDIWQTKGIIEEGVILLTVEDPSSQVGSGGATLNALLVVTEHICARQGYSVVNTDVLYDTHVLIFHLGRSFPCDGCGHAFVTLPLSRQQAVAEGLVTNLELLLNMMTYRAAVNSPPGVWICSTDMFLELPEILDVQSFAGVDVCAVSVPVTVDYAKQHGVYKISAQGLLEDIVYQGSVETIKTCSLPSGRVPVVSGVVYFSAKIAEKLLMSPLNACTTYLGLDSGARPTQLSLFFDILLSMCSDVTREAFISGERCGPYGQPVGAIISHPDLQLMTGARRMVWQLLRGCKARVVVNTAGCYSYMSCAGHREHILRLLDPEQTTWQINKQTHSFVQSDVVSDDAIFVNSIIDTGTSVGSGSVLSHSHLPTGMKVGHDSIISGICSSDLPVTDPTSTFCNRPWQHLFTMTGLCKEDLWDTHLEGKGQCLLTARLFPVFHCHGKIDWRDVLWLMTPGDKDMSHRWRSSWRLSLEEILSNVDLAAEFDWRRRLYFSVAKRQVRQTLMAHMDRGLTQLYVSAVTEGYAHAMLSVLDEVAVECQSAGIAARTLANIACLLSCMARGHGGLQSGPAANQCWKPAMLLLEKQETVQGVQVMATERGHWLDRPDLLVRAARHYEGAAQILIRHAVMTASQFIMTTACPLVPLDTWVTAECPARIDISGGWSDTPPITYEHGGAVLNAAIRLDDKKPIGAKVKRTDRLELVLHLVGEGGDNTHWVISDLSQMADYSQPNAPGEWCFLLNA
ncbi:L-fucose kinase [Lamellibrachia satsuma]|nr:L-fucose kinase [Lamellibrachia satsuma]